MTRIPGFMLRQEVQVEKYQGEGAYGPSWGVAETVAARVESLNQLVRDRDGNEVVASARAFFFPEVELPPESKVTWAGTAYTVLTSSPQTGHDGTTHHLECWLR